MYELGKGRDFTLLTAAEAAAALAGLGRRDRRKTAQALIYHKRHRPADLREQAALLETLSAEPALLPNDRDYAMIAAAHKASELVDRDLTARLIPALTTILERAMGLPARNALRLDGVHMRFSVLNVLLNGGILTGHPERGAWARRTRDALDGIDPRRVSPYLFNSTSNIVKTVGLSLIVEPEELGRAADQVKALLFYAIRLRYAGNPVFALTRRFGPKRLGDLRFQSAFGKMEDSFVRLDAIQRAAEANADAGDRVAALARLAEACVAQIRPEQKAAMLAAVESHCAPQW
ncbi:hypothetical protein [Roseivivax sp. CAU 1761]